MKKIIVIGLALFLLVLSFTRREALLGLIRNEKIKTMEYRQSLEGLSESSSQHKCSIRNSYFNKKLDIEEVLE